MGKIKNIYTEKEKEILEMAFKYKLIYEDILTKLPEWKKEIINSNTGQYDNDRVVIEFAKEVVNKAESIK